MQKRQRIPTIFSIYMVDVLCCALGCVILLWQVNYQEAQEQTTLAKENEASALAALEQLKNANFSVDSMSTQIKTLSDELAAKNKRLVQVTLELQETLVEKNRQQKLALVYKNDYDNAKKAEAQLAVLLDSLRADYKDLAKKSELTASDLAEKIRLGRDMLRKIAALEKDLDKRQSDAVASAAKMDEKNTLLADVQARNKKLEAQLSQMQAAGKDYQVRITAFDLRSKLLEQALDRSRKDLLDSSKRQQELILAQELLGKRLTLSSKELEDARALAAALQTDKVSLLEQARTIRLAAENRFAGITLTGNRVIFLVDMSGSMEFVEERITDPDKWPLVCATVAKIMQSLPNLRHYQVILFSDRARYPMGNENSWIAYHPKSSPKAVMDALKATKPQGETNMYAAFAEAFRYREAGLDTVYVFSDGLPTSGEGLPANAANLGESQKTEILGKYLRTRLKNVWNRPAANEPRVRINTIGFFYESPDVGAFLWALAREHDGSFVGMSRP